MERQEFLRGQIYHVIDNPETPAVGSEIWANRPAIIVSNDTNNENSDCVEVVYCSLSFKQRVIPTHVKLQCNGKPAVAKCEQIHSVDKSRLTEFLGQITTDEQRDIDAALCISLQIVPNGHVLGIFKKWENYIKHYHLKVTDEQKALNDTLRNNEDVTTIIERLTKERDSYKALCEAKEQTLQAINALSK